VKVGDAGRFDLVVRAGFAQRRKTLRNALQSLLSADAIAAAGIDPGARAEDVDVAGWIALAQAF
jgi:16S rRNA (adenine1518-N6/adenine1519-N6)-dimethyltransferase